jgi:hypothetical protein
MASTFRPTFPRSYSDPDCHICERMAETKSITQEGDAALCLLCDRLYCEKYKGKEEGVCEINHLTYYRKHYGPRRIFRSLEHRREVLGEEKGQTSERAKEIGGEGTNEERAGEGEGGNAGAEV